jgi:hypothetical protein
MKKSAKIMLRQMAVAQSYDVIGPVRHGFDRASVAGASSWTSQFPFFSLDVKLTWMNAVAMMTPEPKYLAKKKAYSIYLLFFTLRRMNMGKPAPDWREL